MSSLDSCSDERTCRRRRASPPEESEHISCNCIAANNNCCSVNCNDGGINKRMFDSIEMPSPSFHSTLSSSVQGIKLRRRRHGSYLCSQIVLATTALMVLLLSSSTTISTTTGVLFASAFSPPLPSSSLIKQLSPSCYDTTTTTRTQLHAVRKRVGSHHQPTNQNYIAASPRTTTNNNNSAPTPRRRKNNVFEQFTPDYIASPFDVDLGPAADKNGHVDLSHKDDIKTNNGKQQRRRGRPSKKHSTTASVDTNTIKNANKVNLRLQSLLLNDEGEINPYLPDDSPEAAQQLAQFHTYSKVSEEARRKAKESVSSHPNDEEEDEDVEGGRVVATTRNIHNLHDTSATAAHRRNTNNKRRMSIRATVKETGSDSISSYTKSLGQHELLHKDDEVLLGRQVRMLMVLEEKRMELEEELLR